MLGLPLGCDRPLSRKEVGLRYHRKHSATGVLLHLSRDSSGGYFGRVTKSAPDRTAGAAFKNACGSDCLSSEAFSVSLPVCN